MEIEQEMMKFVWWKEDHKKEKAFYEEYMTEFNCFPRYAS